MEEEKEAFLLSERKVEREFDPNKRKETSIHNKKHTENKGKKVLMRNIVTSFFEASSQ